MESRIEDYTEIIPGTISTGKLHGYLLGSVAPRPIAFASTIDAEGNPNLAPFSFFNCFGSNPPILIFSPARRVRDNTLKHTLENCIATREVVINMVNYAMVEQMSLASCEYSKGTNEFIKAGFTPLPSKKVKPFRVKESPVQMECLVKDIIETGTEGGAGNLIICEIIAMHIKNEVLDENGFIDPKKIDHVARLGSDWYCRVNGDAIFEVEKPVKKTGIGFDHIPEPIRLSSVLTGNDLGKLGNTETLPTKDQIAEFVNGEGKSLFHENTTEEEIHTVAANFLKQNSVEKAWMMLLYFYQNNS